MDTLSVPSPLSSHLSQLSPDEQQLLAKLEEQNRLLETDSKSSYSVNGVLRSPSSPRIFSFEEDSRTWGSVVENWDKWSKKRVKQLKEMIRRGIHPHVRPTVWQMLCNSHRVSVHKEYSELLQKTSPSETLIQRDLDRLLPQHSLFEGLHGSLQQPLFNILKAYSVLDRDVGHHQGSVFLAGLLLMQMPEEQAFGVFLRLMQDFRLRELYRPHMVELGCCMFQLEGLIQDQLPELFSHFQTQAFKIATFSSSWFLTVFLSCLPPTAANRVFDIFMCEGLEIVFRVGLAILQLTQTELMNLDAEGMTQFLEKTAPKQMNTNPDQMIMTAYQIKYDIKKMKRLEKEYMAMKVKEMEEQEEIKKLQSENKALRHRIDTLEKRQNEDAVWRLGQEGVKVRLREAELRRGLKQMEIKKLLMEKNISVPEHSSVYLHEQLVSGKLREADTLTELREVRNHLKDMEEKWKEGGSRVRDLQGELMNMRFREVQALVQLTQDRHRLLQLQTQDQLYCLQIRRITEQMSSQRQHLQELTTQNQHLHSLLGQTSEEDQHKECEDEEQNDGTATATNLQHQIAELQAQIQRLSRQKKDTRLYNDASEWAAVPLASRPVSTSIRLDEGPGI